MLDRVLALVVDVKREERRALFWSFAYFFLILSAYYVLRPLRDNAGISGGTRALPWLGPEAALRELLPRGGAIRPQARVH